MVLVYSKQPKLTNDGTYSAVDFPSGASIYSHDENGNSFFDYPGALRLQSTSGAVTYANQRFEARGGLLVGLAPSDEYIMPAGRPAALGQVLTAAGPDVNTVTWETPAAPGIGEAPSDGKNYVRNNGAWVALNDTLELRDAN